MNKEIINNSRKKVTLQILWDKLKDETITILFLIITYANATAFYYS